ncbi:MAG: hypothetical protein AUJ71_04280 [Candidatus Omnitrophica bacterium CG1_02_49_16]|nr:MAG: hypothetical protein AUJ71_04280 [Candidatus Omnitrophica bacterium CG1_02_49_16]
MKESIRDSFFIYERIRRIFLLGLNIKPLLDLVDARPDERILDAGCGFGHLAKYFENCDYTGIDNDPARIAWAKENIGETRTRRFIAADICRTGFGPNHFDKAIAYGLLHHLPDKAALDCLKEFSRTVKRIVVFSDPVYSKWHLINNLLCKLDRGGYVRNAEGYLRICGNQMALQKKIFFYAHNRLARYFLTVFIPK